MLRLYLGRAGSGKTSYILNELKKLAGEGRGGNVLIVPEQYSHDCERALAACGDSVCLYAEVLSFTRLASRVFAETGGMAERMLDAGGRMLAMSRAYMAVSSHLKVYDVGGRRPDFLKNLLATYDELRSAGAGAGELMTASERAGGGLGDKLEDLALIFEAFDAVKERSGVDVRDRLERLAQEIGRSSVGDTGRIFIDGFTDFTYQESAIIVELLKKGADVTVALGCGELFDTELTFRLPVKTAGRLLETARELGVEAEILRFPEKPGRDGALRYMERHLMDHAAPQYDGNAGSITLLRAGSISEECAAAAARILNIVRGGGRFRDVAVVSTRWDIYGGAVGGVFAKYGVPVTRTEKSDILEKPVMVFITGALDIILNNWDYVNIFRYLKTGLAGLEPEERDVLENYVLKWNIRGESMWTRPGGWTMAPEGYGEMTEGQSEELERVNALRERAAGPLVKLSAGLEGAESALGKVRAVYEFMEDVGLYAMLREKERELKDRGNGELAGEYGQLWDITVGALQQFADILGETGIGTEEFIRLLKLVLGQYRVGVIPTSVDSVRAGDMSRIRARGVKHLIVLGATDDALPARAGEAGVFSQDERRRLDILGMGLTDDREDELSRELMGVYASLTVPTESLMLTRPETDRRSYITGRLEKLFGISETAAGEETALCSRQAAFELAASGRGRAAARAAAYFQNSPEWSGRLRAIRDAVSAGRGSLGRDTAARLYGGKLRLSASQIDKYYSCRFAYFLQYGLRAKPRREAALDAPESGTFMHFVLEGVAREAESKGGFGAIPREDAGRMASKYAGEYAGTRLGGLENKSGRFRYLFGRLTRAAGEVAMTMHDELCRSDFKPVDFELRFAPGGDLPPAETAGGDSVVGAVDRVDGYVRDGKLYLRVVDYKTGKKAMDLRDIYYGLGLQMLIYLFALKRQGRERYGMEIEPAGVLYSPARDDIVRSDRDLEGEEYEKARVKLLRHSGLVLADPEIIEAMERGEKKYLPVTVSSSTGEVKGNCVDAERLGKLGRSVDRLIERMAEEIRSGALSANPYLRSRVDSACMYCDYFEACKFADGQEGESYRRLSRLKTAEVWRLIEEEAK